MLTTVALLLALAGGHQDPYQARVFPQVSMPGADITFTFEQVGPVTEGSYCLGVDVTWPDSTHSTHQPDCPSWDEYQRGRALAAECEEKVVVCPPGFECWVKGCEAEPYEPQRRWIFHSSKVRMRYGYGENRVSVRFFLPNKKWVDRSVTFFIGGGE